MKSNPIGSLSRLEIEPTMTRRVTIYLPPKPKSPLFLAGAGAAFATGFPVTFPAGLAATFAAGLAAGLAAALTAGFATTLPLAGAAAGFTSAFFPNEPNGLAFFTGAGGAAGAATFLAAPPLSNLRPKRASRFDGGTIEPGQLNDGMAVIAVWLKEIGVVRIAK